jgi:hypothetical protein
MTHRAEAESFFAFTGRHKAEALKALVGEDG